jgi:hypothetical protein
VTTIQKVFPNCRIYRESEAPPASKIEEEGRDFTNMAMFFTKPLTKSSSSSSLSPSSARKEINFRQPTLNDLLGSQARKMFLLPIYEVDYAVFEEREGDGGLLLRNDTERFRGWQQKSALGHWAVMRTVLPEEIWEGW